MGSFDAERYLRLIGERLLIAGDPGVSAGLGELTEAAGALVAAGVIGGDVAQGVVDEYGDAIAVRAGAAPRTWRAARAWLRGSPRHVSPVRERRIVRCEQVVEREQGILRIDQVQLAEDETTIVVEFRPRPGAPARTDRDGRARPEPVKVTIVDDRGTETVGWFGSPSSEPRRGHMGTVDPLAMDAAWIEFEGERCALVDERLAVSASAGPADEQDPALRHLWRQVAIHSHYGLRVVDLESAINALTAAGVVSAEDVAQVRAVRGMLTGLQHGGEPARDAGHVPEPWRSMLARGGRDDGPVATILASTIAPTIDGISVAVRTVESRPTEFTVEVECTPSLGLTALYDWDSQERLAWWAADDRGNRYLGQTREWVSHDHAGREDDSHGMITFWPALDPTARRLNIIPTAETTQALVSIPLTSPE